MKLKGNVKQAAKEQGRGRTRRVPGDLKQAAKVLGLRILEVSKGPEPLIVTNDGVFTPTAIIEEAAIAAHQKRGTR